MTSFLEVLPPPVGGNVCSSAQLSSPKESMACEAGSCNLLSVLRQLQVVTKGELSSLSHPPYLSLNYSVAKSVPELQVLWPGHLQCCSER